MGLKCLKIHPFLGHPPKVCFITITTAVPATSYKGPSLCLPRVGNNNNTNNNNRAEQQVTDVACCEHSS